MAVDEETSPGVKRRKLNNEDLREEGGGRTSCESNGDAPTVCHFIKRRKQPRNTRKKSESVSMAEDTTATEVVSTAESSRLQKNNPLAVTTKRASQVDDLKGEDGVAGMFSYESDRKIMPSGPADQGATLHMQHDTEEERLAGQGVGKAAASLSTVGEDGKKIYRGMNAYDSYVEKREQPKAMRTGPVKGTTNVRQMAIMDYQPNICKDYKETGYCGYGDNCIYLHDRGDYKSGWQIERDWEESRKREREMKMMASDNEEEEDEPLDDLPFACMICRGDFKQPVLTLCGHYFCENCAISHHRNFKNRCFVCNENTKGILNAAPKLEAKLKAKALREKEEEKGEDREDGGQDSE